MSLEECDVFDPVELNCLSGICSKFNGDVNNKLHISTCFKYCDYYNMQRVKGKKSIFIKNKGKLKRK